LIGEGRLAHLFARYASRSSNYLRKQQ
jgi:hypothetical protein